ncbi:hypothetical protein SeMB42_g03483 [Synchytrium endobioticum]|uniref:Uncharacterized protein n=1 Tax=Synchytrium endobioticum TaxID=286115 RepID=A0A507D871_9FUNG|nr:hypothetical protein SeLEV6574_g04271 [Synchytrium endobioticum]TPX47040.1 hypothetical protein SeMB42_g03483 [Synchytrium endobioticum]
MSATMKSPRRVKLPPGDPPSAANPRLSTESLKARHDAPGNPLADPSSSPGPADDWLPPKTLLKPPGQLQLSDPELNEELTRILNANNPQAPQNIARYNNTDRAFKTVPYAEHVVVHFEFDGYMIYTGGDDADAPNPLVAVAAGLNNLVTSATSAANDAPQPQPPPRPTTGDPGEGDDATGDPVSPSKAAPPSRNQFNFSERASQTLNHPYRDRWTNTDPPPRRTFADTVNQFAIYDAYIEDAQQKEKAAAKAKAPAAGVKAQKDDHTALIPPSDAPPHSESEIHRNAELRRALAMVERMANQNTFDQVTQDYKYWEDAGDEFREGRAGVLLPLWKFICEKEKKKQTTAICWNPEKHDLFAVGYGSYEFTRQGPGMVACFSLKNPSHPEYLCVTEAGVMSVDFHPQYPSLFAVGLYDGSVAVYDLKKKTDAPIFKSTSKSKHADPVWQVSWQKDDLDDNSNFFSISSDGRVVQWTLLKNELVMGDVIKLTVENNVGPMVDLAPAPGPSLAPHPASAPVNSAAAAALNLDHDKKLFGLEGGCSFDFNRASDHLFIVGTEEGRLHKCSKLYNSQYLLSFEGHQMAVYTAKYNPFLARVFLTASADWTVKLWDHDQTKPLMSFDLCSPVGDVAWAPYSSSVFAACTSDGKVYVYDLSINKYVPICEQPVVKKAKLTHLAFSVNEPILLVGDDRGHVQSLKLSPNLRRPARNVDLAEDQKLADILAI